jgi:hypothetical protein
MLFYLLTVFASAFLRVEGPELQANAIECNQNAFSASKIH